MTRADVHNGLSLCMQVYNEQFTDATSERTERMFHYLDPDNTGFIDYLGWSQTIKLQVCLLAAVFLSWLRA